MTEDSKNEGRKNMRVGFCFSLACRNLIRKKRYAAVMLCSVLFIMLLMTLWQAFRVGLSGVYETFLAGKESDCYYFLEISLDSDGKPVQNNSYRAYQLIRDMPECGERIIAFSEPDLVGHIRKEDVWSAVNMREATMTVDGTVYQGVNDYSFDFEEPILPDAPRTNYPVMFRLAFTWAKNCLSENDLTEFDYKYGTSPMLYGTDTVEFGEVVISDYFLERFGFPKSEYGNLIGKKVTFSADVPVLEDVVVAGIVDSRVFRMTRFQNGNIMCGAQLIYRASEQEYAAWNLEFTHIAIPIREYGDILTVSEKLEQAGVVDEMMAVNNAGLNAYFSLNLAKVIVERMFGLFAFLMSATVALFLFNALWQNAKERAPYCGMLKAIGMRAGEIVLVLFAEVFIVATLCAAVSVPISAVLFREFSKGMRGVFTVSYRMKFGELIRIGLLVDGAVTLLVVLIQLPMILTAVKKTPSRLLAEDVSK